jgi:L-gulonate 3-dehydrogenase
MRGGLGRMDVAVIGAGLIGSAWATSFAKGGCQVCLFDSTEGAVESAVKRITAQVHELARNELLGGQAPADVLERVVPCASLEDAVAGADLVQENVPEILDVKVPILQAIGDAAGVETVIASSTSSLVPSILTEEVPGRHRCLVAHPINPPYLVPVVELVPAPWTARDVLQRARTFYESVGQTTLTMKREIDGFVVNRLQGALLHEAFRLVAGGYVSTRDVDRAIKDGLGLRWSFMGPFETIDLNAPGGVRDYVERYGPLYRSMAASQAEPCDWTEAVDGIEAERAADLPRADLERRQAWRDRRLMALARWKHEMENDNGS